MLLTSGKHHRQPAAQLSASRVSWASRDCSVFDSYQWIYVTRLWIPCNVGALKLPWKWTFRFKSGSGKKKEIFLISHLPLTISFHVPLFLGESLNKPSLVTFSALFSKPFLSCVFSRMKLFFSPQKKPRYLFRFLNRQNCCKHKHTQAYNVVNAEWPKLTVPGHRMHSALPAYGLIWMECW